jgi:signal transduction histidine kinase
MKLTKQQIADAGAVYELYWDSYLTGDADSFASTLDEQFNMIGTSENEICNDKAGGVEFCRAQANEVVGKVEKRNRQMDSIPLDGIVLINEFFDIYILVDTDWNFYSKSRVSTLLRETSEGWKVVQQHGSLPDNRVQGDEAIAIQKISKENHELRDTVKRQTAELENKNREAQIEASLERVRAKAMAMHSSKDIETATAVMFNELTRLGINMERCGISIMNETPIFEVWSTLLSPKNKEVVKVISGHLDSRTHPMNHQFHQNWQEKKDYSYYKLDGDEVRKYYDILEKQPGYHFPKIARYPDHQIAYCFFFNEGAIFVYTKVELTAETKNIFKRFAKVFEQTYTRFLDLQKTEAQARKAEIEASLERVRAKAMAMHSSKDIESATVVVFNELSRLGIDMERCGIGILNETPIAEIWSTPLSPENKEVVNVITGQLNLRIHPLLQTLHQGWSEKKDFSTYKLVGDEVRKYYNKLEKQPGYNFPKIASYPNQQVVHNYYFKEGGIFVFTKNELSAETKNIFQRFAKVFEQTYTRFLDIQKAEAQAIEATKQASLDRVRGEIASMRSAEDLEIITPLVWNELTTLGIPFIRCGVFIVHEEEEEAEVYLSKPDGTSLAVMNLSFGSSDLVTQTVDAWRNGSVYTQHWTQEEFLDWGRSMVEQGQVRDLESYRGAEAPPESLNLHFIPFKQGMLYVGSTNQLSDEEIDLAASLAETFSIAYARYEDFVKLEKAKAGIEEALAELKATQSQLIQQEKLASLGQLTAGIAHEIKNPLNFVTNFSEVSLEMIEEAREEVRRGTEDRGPGSEKSKVKSEKQQSPFEWGSERSEQGDDAISEKDENPSLLLEILDDIEMNLRKIHDHGSRADGIVKSMLQHSRGGSGKMEPTPLNPLIKEYVNLAFHGMRAGKGPIDVDIDLQLDEQVGDVPLVAEDFSRVILNLCNNAFDAMREKDLSPNPSPEGEGRRGEGKYSPKLTVQTEKKDGAVTIEIEDNGPGIPDDIKDKILQPFFTTKKGTQGTGLGLSITNDIVKAHGGEMQIVSQPGSTVFSIRLNQK